VDLTDWAEERYAVLISRSGPWGWISAGRTVVSHSQGWWPRRRRWVAEAIRVRLQSLDGATFDDLYLEGSSDKDELDRGEFTYRGVAYDVRWLDGEERLACMARVEDWP